MVWQRRTWVSPPDLLTDEMNCRRCNEKCLKYKKIIPRFFFLYLSSHYMNKMFKKKKKRTVALSPTTRDRMSPTKKNQRLWLYDALVQFGFHCSCFVHAPFTVPGLERFVSLPVRFVQDWWSWISEKIARKLKHCDFFFYYYYYYYFVFNNSGKH